MIPTSDPAVWQKSYFSQVVPRCRYDGVSAFRIWQQEARRKLSALLGMERMEATDPSFRITDEMEKGENRITYFQFQSEPGYAVRGALMLPRQDGASSKLPLCLCLQGHSRGMHISLGQPKWPGDEKTITEGDRDFAVRAVREGFAAVTIEQRGMGECGGNEEGPCCHQPAMTALLRGRTLLGERIWDVSRTLDVVTRQFGDRITLEGSVCVGNSGGGTTTYYTGCLEERFALLMPSCAVSTYYDSIVSIQHCVCNYIPGIANYFDMGDLSGLIAPKKLIFVCGKEDPIFPIDGALSCYNQARALYRAAGAESQCAIVVGPGGHRFYADLAWRRAKKLLAEKE